MAKKKKATTYSLVEDTIEGMRIGQKKTIDVPEELGAFRKYLTEISQRRGVKFTTKVIKATATLEIMRVKYFNIYSKEVE